MVSEFLSEEYEQVKTKAIPIFETLFPNCVALFAFDNSSNHAAFKSDALVASRMNLKSEGKQLKIKDTVFRLNNQHQLMVNENGELKEIKQILIEHGLWKNGLNANCQLCLQCTVLAALESVNIITIRKFARKAWYYMDLYRKEITGFWTPLIISRLYFQRKLTGLPFRRFQETEVWFWTFISKETEVQLQTSILKIPENQNTALDSHFESFRKLKYGFGLLFRRFQKTEVQLQTPILKETDWTPILKVITLK
ncbi:hypothetical protein C1645_817767 [Glomus cerebriforme]|uniref:Uncharacterized protein n=1 Tax=Glomus cerebriforme TaxID=658196 RepID=A0A397TE47_9GLOM|nr:hypothetical protein C1645_817767 [Glomus cerebriforme]